ncbi:hypothetical protein J3A83DRAFT_4362970 [Scleroderma citrinum]
MEFPTGAGATGAPISPDAWKRAVYRSAPPSFYVEFLPPEKQGGSHSFGLRVYPLKDDVFSISARSNASHLGYEIWRKWEDCLNFQECLEVEYSRMAREKRNRLTAGKGVKKNGVYFHGDQAASFESLPPGPDPHSVAQDIHNHVPKLTKKGTIFRASQATINQRQLEFQAMINALFNDDVPTLIKELRTTHTFTDFFGFWRRDHDLARKLGKEFSPVKARNTVTSSLLSEYFSASSPSLSDISPSLARQRSQNQSTRRFSAASDTSSGFPSSSSVPSTPVSHLRRLPSASRQPIIAQQDEPVRFGHVPETLISERPTSMLESLPEDCESPAPVRKMGDQSLRQRRRAGSTASEVHRSARVYGPHDSFSALSEFAEQQPDYQSSVPRQPRYSWQTTASSRAVTYLEELGIDYSLPAPHPESKHIPRASMCSMASTITKGPVDAVIPRGEHGSYRRRPMSFPEDDLVFADDEPWVDHDGHDEGDDILDAYFDDSIFPLSPTPTHNIDTPTSITFHFPETISPRHSGRRSSLAPSVSSWSTASSHEGTVLSIKAMHEESIIMLRIPRTLPFAELRKKIYDKFVQQEKSPISESFAIAVLVTPAERAGGGQGRRGSLSSNGKKAALHFVASQEEWEQAVTHHGTKLLLRIIGSKE